MIESFKGHLFSAGTTFAGTVALEKFITFTTTKMGRAFSPLSTKELFLFSATTATLHELVKFGTSYLKFNHNFTETHPFEPESCNADSSLKCDICHTIA